MKKQITSKLRACFFVLLAWAVFIAFLPETITAQPAGINEIQLFPNTAFTGDTVNRFTRGDNVYIRLVAQLSAALRDDIKLADTCVIKLTNNSTNESIELIFDRKIASDTNSADSTYYIMRSGLLPISLQIPGLTNNELNYLGVDYNQTVTVSILGGIATTKNFTIAAPASPVSINSLYVMNSSYTDRISADFRFTQSDIIYIQATAQNDAEPLTQDTLLVTVKSNQGELMTLELLETGKNTGVYRSSQLRVSNITNPTTKTVKEIFGDSVWIESLNKSDTIYFVNPKTPATIYSAKYYSNSGFTNIMSNQSFTKPLTFYAQIVANDSEPYYIDTITARIQRASSIADSITVTLTESAKNSGIYRSLSVSIGDITNQNTRTLRAEYGETVGLLINDILYDTFILSPVISKEPVILNSLAFMTAGFGTVLPDAQKITKGDRLYIQASAQSDAEPLAQDTFLLTVKKNGVEIMTVTMLETALNSGIFRNSDIVITDVTDSSLKTIGETFGDTITIHAKALVDTIIFVLPRQPSFTADNAKFYDAGFLNVISRQKFDKPLTLNVQVDGTDLEPYYIDTLPVIIQRNNSSVDSITIILTETSINSGKFRSASFNIANYTSQIQRQLRAEYGDTIGLRINNVIYDTIAISNSSGPSSLYEIYFTNSNYSNKLTADYHIDVNEKLYIEASGDNGDPNIIDTFLIYVKNNTRGDSIWVVMTETSKTSGIYRNSEITVRSDLTAQYLKYLKALYYDSISVITANYPVSDDVYMLRPASPTTIYDAFFQNEQYTDLLRERSLPLSTKVNISLFSEDLELRYNDTKIVYVKNSTRGDSIYLIAREINSGDLRGLNTITLADYTNNTEYKLKADEGDRINLIIDNIIYDTFYIVVNDTRIVANSFNFIVGYDNPVVRADTRYPDYATINLELNGVDKDPLSLNYIFVTVYDKLGGSINLRMNETDLNTGKFRGQFHLRSFTDQTNSYVYAVADNDTVTIVYNGETIKQLQMIVQRSTSAGQIISVRFKKQDYFEDFASEYNFDDIVYIEAVGYDSNPYTIDAINVECFAYQGIEPAVPPSESKITVSLTETGLSTGIFRGSFKLKRLTNDTVDELRVDYGDTIKVRVVADNTKYDERRMTLPVSPMVINELKFYLDASYSQILPYYKQMDFQDILYIQATGSDVNPLNADTVGIILQDGALYKDEPDTQDGIILDIEKYVLTKDKKVNFSLVETAKNSGVYRGQVSIGIDNVNSEELGKIIGTTRGNNILLFWDRDYYEWADMGRPVDTQPILRAKVKMIEYDQPDYIRDIQFMKDDKFTEILRTPHLTMQQSAENNLPDLKYIYIRAYADTMTASDLLEDTFDLTLKVYKLDANGQIIHSLANSEQLDTNANLGINTLNVVNIRMIELGKNSGIYTNKNDVKVLVNYDNTTQAPQSQDGQVIGIDMSAAPYHLLVVEPTIRHTFNVDTYLQGRKPPINKAETNVIASDTSFIAFPIPPKIVNRIRIFENNNYINPLIPAERTYNPPFNKLYIKAEDSFDLTDTKFGEININSYSNDALKDEVYLHLQVHPFSSNYFNHDAFISEYGDSVLKILLKETAPSSNEYVVDPNRVPTVVTRVDVNTPKHTNQSSQELHILKGDTISVRAYNHIDQRFVDTLHQSDTPYILFSSARNKYPLIREIKLMNSTYTEEYTSNLLHGQNLYLQAYGSEGGSNQILRDTVPVLITNTVTGETITLHLTETTFNSEIYRLEGSIFPKLDKDYTLKESRVLKADTGQEITFYVEGSSNTNFTLTKQVASPRKPTDIFSLKIVKDAAGILDYMGEELGYFARGTKIYIELSADPGDAALIDNTENDVYVQNGRGQRIYVTLIEDAPASGKYRGSFMITSLTNDTLDELDVLDNETFVVYTTADPTKFSQVNAKVAIPLPPTTISSIGFKDNAYLKTLLESSGNTILNRQTLYIELNGQDRNPNIIDFVDIYVICWQGANTAYDTPSGWIKIPLTETGLNTGKYRGIAQLGDYNDTDQRMIKAGPTDLIATIAVATYNDTNWYLQRDVDIMSKPPYRRIDLSVAGGYADTVYVAVTSSPKQIFGITLKSSDYVENRVINKENPLRYGEIIYVEAQGDIANTLLKDTTTVRVTGYDVNGNRLNSTSLIVELVESNIQSGTYRGSFKIASDPYTHSQPARAYYEENYFVNKIAAAPAEYAPIIDGGVVINDPYMALFGPLNSAYFIIESTVSPTVIYGDPSMSNSLIDASPIFNVFPNPWKKGDAIYDGVDYKGTARSGIRFTGLDNSADIKIFDALGKLIFSSPCDADNTLGYGQFLWTGVNTNGKQVSSGIYIYVTKDRTGQNRRGKIAVIR